MTDFDFNRCHHCQAALPELAEGEERRIACPHCGRRLATEHPGGMTLPGGFHIRQMAPGTTRAEKRQAAEKAPQRSAPPPAPAAPPPRVDAPAANTDAPPAPPRLSPPAAAAPPVAAPQPSAEPPVAAPPVAAEEAPAGKPNLRLKREVSKDQVAGPWYVKFIKKSLFKTTEREEGPFSYEELRCLIRDKTLTPETLVRREDEAAYQPAGAYDGLFKAR